MTPMKWFFSFLKKYRGLMIVGILLTTAVSVLSVVNPYISGQIVDQVISGGKYDRLMPFIGCLIGVTIVMGVLPVPPTVMLPMQMTGTSNRSLLRIPQSNRR